MGTSHTRRPRSSVRSASLEHSVAAPWSPSPRQQLEAPTSSSSTGTLTACRFSRCSACFLPCRSPVSTCLIQPNHRLARALSYLSLAASCQPTCRSSCRGPPCPWWTNFLFAVVYPQRLHLSFVLKNLLASPVLPARSSSGRRRVSPFIAPDGARRLSATSCRHNPHPWQSSLPLSARHVPAHSLPSRDLTCTTPGGVQAGSQRFSSSLPPPSTHPPPLPQLQKYSTGLITLSTKFELRT